MSYSKQELAQKFYDFFDKIPNEEWFTGGYVNANNPAQRCALGHCLEDSGRKAPARNLVLGDLLEHHVADINDARDLRYAHLPTPKARILAALTDAINSQLPNLQEKI